MLHRALRPFEQELDQLHSAGVLLSLLFQELLDLKGRKLIERNITQALFDVVADDPLVMFPSNILDGFERFKPHIKPLAKRRGIRRIGGLQLPGRRLLRRGNKRIGSVDESRLLGGGLLLGIEVKAVLIWFSIMLVSDGDGKHPLTLGRKHFQTVTVKLS